MAKTSSPYSASFTGATMMFNEMNTVVSMLLKDNSSETVKKIRTDAQYLQINSTTARERVTSELVKRFKMVPTPFWESYVNLAEAQKRLALLFVILKTYRLLFEFQVNLAIAKYNSIDRTINRNDVLTAMSEIASRDSFVDSWTQTTRERAAEHYLAILKQAGLIDVLTGELKIPDVSDADFVDYIKSGDLWFLQACFLPNYRIENIKQLAL